MKQTTIFAFDFNVQMFFNYIAYQFLITIVQKMQMFPQFSMIKDFDALQDFQSHRNSRTVSFFHKDDMIRQTQDNQLDQLNDSLPTRSIKTKLNPLEPSFGQRFMKVHSRSFKTMLQKYMEYTFSQTLLEFNQRILPRSIDQEQRQQDCYPEQFNLKELLNLQKNRMTSIQKQKFLLDLSYQSKLNEFLSFACNLTCKQISVDLLYFANIIWQTYIPKQQYGLNQKQIDNMVQSILNQKILQDNIKTISLLNPQKMGLVSKLKDKQTFQQLRNLIKSFGVTVLLIIEEYFNNPYYETEEAQNLKRNFLFKDISNDSFSDGEDEMQSYYGCKKRKQ